MTLQVAHCPWLCQVALLIMKWENCGHAAAANTHRTFPPIARQWETFSLDQAAKLHVTLSDGPILWDMSCLLIPDWGAV